MGGFPRHSGQKMNEKNKKSRDKKIALCLFLPWLSGVFLKMEPGLFVSLILASEILGLRLEALKQGEKVYDWEDKFYFELILGSLGGLFLQKASVHHGLVVLFGGVAGSLVSKKYKLPLFMLLLSLGLSGLMPTDASRGLHNLLSFFYGILMIASALGLMERRRKD